MITDLSCVDFCESLASKAPVPGGGGVAAMLGALGGALCEMAGNLTVGKKKYAQYDEENKIIENRHYGFCIYIFTSNFFL